jgi:DNA-directed RNA polymerase specialized sigma24 family protein
VIESLPRFRGKSNLNTYSKAVVRNVLLDLVDSTQTDKRRSNTNTHSLTLDGRVQESESGAKTEPMDHEANLLRGHAREASRLGWHPGMEEEDRVESLDDHALLALVDEVLDGTAAWWKMVDRESWETVAERMGTTVADARRRIPLAWAEVQDIPEVIAIVTTALKRRMVNP